ncbi:hypothetical protein HPB51_010572 [Rhipicephalus microplus]|uniref:Uncharacterized protein n=1 Tax=Rhipicephalus microplus TaxID=6941 RepID=A0A9J6E8I3_RHIMP|nr:hypothetical protein HPB51_010572 [Rhipicephalus microplus]
MAAMRCTAAIATPLAFPRHCGSSDTRCGRVEYSTVALERYRNVAAQASDRGASDASDDALGHAAPFSAGEQATIGRSEADDFVRESSPSARRALLTTTRAARRLLRVSITPKAGRLTPTQKKTGRDLLARGLNANSSNGAPFASIHRTGGAEQRDSEIGAPCPGLLSGGMAAQCPQEGRRAHRNPTSTARCHTTGATKLKKKRKARCLRGGRQSSPFERVSKKRKGAENRFPYLRHVADDRERASYDRIVCF